MKNYLNEKSGAALNYNKNDESWSDVTSATERAEKKLCKTKKRDKLEKMLSFLDIYIIFFSLVVLFARATEKREKDINFF